MQCNIKCRLSMTVLLKIRLDSPSSSLRDSRRWSNTSHSDRMSENSKGIYNNKTFIY